MLDMGGARDMHPSTGTITGAGAGQGWCPLRSGVGVDQVLSRSSHEQAQVRGHCGWLAAGGLFQSSCVASWSCVVF